VSPRRTAARAPVPTGAASPARAHDARARAALPVLRAAVITASDTRSAADDASGDLLVAGLLAAGHAVVDRRIVRDEIAALSVAVTGAIAAGADVVIVTGGTGVAPRDVTPEALRALGMRELPGYGEVFRARSFARVGAPALFSRACAGTLGQAVVFALPGSPDACATALPVLLSGLHHLLHQLRGARPAARGGPPSS
jgi:molybdenum cofactor biosynthesis protein B